MSEYTSSDFEVSIDLNGFQLTYEQFNEVMRARGCPVRAEHGDDIGRCFLAAWDWLFTEQCK